MSAYEEEFVLEQQIIIRFPADVAAQIKTFMENNDANSLDKNISIAPQEDCIYYCFINF